MIAFLHLLCLPCQRIAPLFLAVGTLLLALPVAAQSPLSMVTKTVANDAPAAVAGTPVSMTADELRQRQKEIVAEISGHETATVPEGITSAERARRLRTLKFISYSYQGHLNALSELDEQRRLSSEAERIRTDWTGFAESPPFSIAMIDRLNSDMRRNVMKKHTAEALLKIISARIDSGRNALQKSQESLRQAQEVAERANANAVETARWRRALAQSDELAATVYLSALLASRDVTLAQLDEATKAAEFTTGLFHQADKQVAFAKEELETLKTRLEERQASTLLTLERANADLGSSEKVAAEAADRFEALRSNVVSMQRDLSRLRSTLAAALADAERSAKSAGVLDKLNPFSGSAAKAEVKKLQQQIVTLEKRIAAAEATLSEREREAQLATTRHRNAVITVDLENNRLALLEVERSVWEMRYNARSTLPGAAKNKNVLAERGREMQEVLATRGDQLRSELDATMDQIMTNQSAPGDAREAGYRARMVELLTARERAYRQSLSESEDLREMLQRLLGEYTATAAGMNLKERMGQWFAQANDAAVVFWRFEVFAVEDTIEVDGRKITGSRGVTVGKIFQGIFLVIGGYLVISLLTKAFIAVIARRSKIDPMEAQIAHKWIMTASGVVLVIMAMEFLKIPLTAFAFLGGAIAIGFGFGMQNLLKNLISGLMLLMERPFKIRDVVEVGGIRGEVTGINIRSCTIRSVTGIETLVPNSTFLEQNVTNWTLSNQTVRYTVSIGVAYGANIEEVARLLREIAHQHSAVVRDPAPEVIFEDFGDNALMFSLNVWLVIGQNQIPSRVVLSDLRFMINRSFAEHGIGIPYPQRDVRLDTTSPLSVRVVNEAR